MPRRTPRGHSTTGTTLTRRKPGRPTRLTPETADTIIHSVTSGDHIVTACAAAHVGQATLYRWLQRAELIDEAIANDEPYDPADLAYREFRERLDAARAHALQDAREVVHKVMHGGFVIEEEPALDGNGQVVRDSDGEVVMRRRYAQPDGRLAMTYMSRARPDLWGTNATRVELTGADGAPLLGGVAGAGEGGDPERLAIMATRLAELQQRRAEEPMFGPDGPVEDDDQVYDAEIVEDSDAAPTE